MKKIIAAVLVCLFIKSSWACTIFSLYPNGQNWIGRTFDWAYGHGLVYTNKRNVKKSSLVLLPTDVVSTWTSKYGSVTFNQFGKEFPTGGMNEAGLMIDALELLTSKFPQADARPSFNELQFIQYVLDNFSSIDDLEKNLETIRLSPVGSKLHYFACDIKSCMTIEYIDGKLVTHKGQDLAVSGLANNSYQEHLDYVKDFITFGGSNPIIMDSKLSQDRFVRSNYNAKFINQFKDPIQALFGFLEDVGTINNRWQIIYNQTEKVITFRTQARLDKQRRIDLSLIDFSCASPSQYFDLDSDFAGEVNPILQNFDTGINLQVIKKSVKMQGLPVTLAERLGIYPAETECN